MRIAVARLVVAVSVCSLVTGCDTSASDEERLAPVIARAPVGVADVLVTDTTPAPVPMPGRPELATLVNLCLVRLRDPVSGTIYRLIQSEALAVKGSDSGGHSETIRARGNYDVLEGGTRLPAGNHLRVDCGSNRVLGLAPSSSTPG